MFVLRLSFHVLFFYFTWSHFPLSNHLPPSHLHFPSLAPFPPCFPAHQTPKYESIEDAPDDSAAVRSARWWANYTARNRSFIVDLFAGQLQSTLTCLTCEHRSIVYDPVCVRVDVCFTAPAT